MDNVRIVVAVLVVLLAFTGLQWIANHSLRTAVTGDVQRKLNSTEAEMRRHHDRLQEATKRMEKLLGTVEALSSRVNEAAAKATELGESVRQLEGTVQSLEAALKAAEAARTKGNGP